MKGAIAMLLWVEPFMWALCRFLGNAMTTIGLVGLLVFLGHGLMWLTDKILEME